MDTLTSTAISFVDFPCGGLTLLVAVTNVVTVIPIENVLPIPRPRRAVEGLILFGGAPLPLLHLPTVLGQGREEAHQMMVVDVGETRLALAISHVDTVIDYPLNRIEACPADVSAGLRPFLRATIKDAGHQFVLNLSALAHMLTPLGEAFDARPEKRSQP